MKANRKPHSQLDRASLVTKRRNIARGKQKRAEQDLRESEQRYKMISTVASDYMFSTRLDAHGKLVLNWVAGAFEAITEYTYEEYVAHGGWRAALHPDDLAIDDRDMAKLRANQSVISEVRTLTKSGKTVWVRVYAQPVLDAERKELVGIYGAVQNITERKRAEIELRNKNRALQTLSECNQALVRAPDESSLLNEICRICVEVGGYRMAWVGFAEQDARKTVRPVAQKGFEDGYLNTLDIVWADSERGRGPTGIAIRTRQPYIARDLADNPNYVPWRAAAIQRGYTSSIALPLLANDRALGALNIYAAEPDAFDDEDVNLLTELAGDLAYGVTTLRMHAERERAEQSLRENEQRLGSIYNTVGDVIFHLTVEPDEQYRFSSVNLAFSRVTGLPAQAVVGKTVREIIPEQSLRMVLGKYRQAIGEKAIVRWEETSDYPTGKLIGEVSVAPVFDKAGNCTYLVGSVHDITERKRAEAELRRSADEFAALYEIARDLAAQLDLPVLLQTIVNHAARLIGASDAIIYLYDSAREELELVAAIARMQPLGARFKANEGASGQVLQTRQPLIVDDYQTWEHRRPEYHSIDLRAVAQVPMIYGGEIIGVLGIAEIGKERKITEADVHLLELLAAQAAIAIHNARLLDQVQRVNVELEQRVNERTAQLQTANKELESFSYSVSHDLRAPLRAISGFAEIIARRHRANLNEEGKHYVDNIVQASERMGRLIDDLLQYSRLGRQGVRHEPVRLRDIFGPLASDLAARLKEIGGTLTIPDDLPSVIGDRTLLSQIFSNLLENAITYRKPDVPAQVAVTDEIAGDAVIVRVSDNGIGIAPEHREKIFNVFQRLHGEDEYPGTGIGLATVKKSVELLGGDVWVESSVEQGSTFCVKLPKR